MPKKVKKDPTLPVVLPIIEDEADKELNDSLHPNLPMHICLVPFWENCISQ
jgi:hypothetical protein